MNDFPKWIWQHRNWTQFHWQIEAIHPLLRTIQLKQGILLGKTGLINHKQTPSSALDILLQKSNA